MILGQVSVSHNRQGWLFKTEESSPTPVAFTLQRGGTQGLGLLGVVAKACTWSRRGALSKRHVGHVFMSEMARDGPGGPVFAVNWCIVQLTAGGASVFFRSFALDVLAGDGQWRACSSTVICCSACARVSAQVARLYLQGCVSWSLPPIPPKAELRLLGGLDKDFVDCVWHQSLEMII